MKLTVLERLVLLNILPKEGDFTTLKLVRKLRESLSFDELEHKRLNFIQDGDQVRWNEQVNIEKDVEIGEKANDMVVEALEELNKNKKLGDQHFTLYEKFVIEKAED